MSITTPMRVVLTADPGASATVNTEWIHTHGYTRAAIFGDWSGTGSGTVTMQGTNVGPKPQRAPFQPDPSAVQVADIVVLTNIAPDGTTSNAADLYQNVLPRWIRFAVAETGGVNPMSVTLDVVFKVDG